MQQISELLQDGDLVDRYDAVSQNMAEINRKLLRLQDKQNGSCTSREFQDRIKCLKYQLDCANKGAQRLAEAIRTRMMDL